jgi:hypothetical protein
MQILFFGALLSAIKSTSSPRCWRHRPVLWEHLKTCARHERQEQLLAMRVTIGVHRIVLA